MTDQYGGGPGSTPRPGEPPPGPVVRGPAPAPVVNAVRAMFAHAALIVLRTVVTFGTKNTDKAILNTNRLAGIGSVIIYVVLYALLAMQVRKGKNWARIVTLVFATMTALGGLATLAASVPAFSHVVSLLLALVDVAIVVLLARRPSTQFFKDPAPVIVTGR